MIKPFTKAMQAGRSEKKPRWKKTPIRKECDKLWSEIILKKAGYKSEIHPFHIGKQIGGDHTLVAHHIARKPNFRLRYETDNGICLTTGEHHYGIHGSQEEKYLELIKLSKGEDIYDRMLLFKNAKSPSLVLVKMYLQDELKKLEGI